MLGLVSLNNHILSISQEDKVVEVLLSFCQVTHGILQEVLKLVSRKHDADAHLGNAALLWVCLWASF